MKFGHSALLPIIKIVFLATLVGWLAGLVLPMLIRIFSIDGKLSFSELLASLGLASLVLNIFVVLVSTRTLGFSQMEFWSRINRIFSPVQCRFVGIAGTLTLIIPLLGPLFGGTGKEPFWAFAILGVIGCLFWSIPLLAWFLMYRLLKR